MTLRKRGLGRGLEALLADDSAKEDKHQAKAAQSVDDQSAKDIGLDKIQATEEVDGRTALVVALFKNIQRENRILLEEAEALRKLLEEFEAIVRADLA